MRPNALRAVMKMSKTSLGGTDCVRCSQRTSEDDDRSDGLERNLAGKQHSRCCHTSQQLKGHDAGGRARQIKGELEAAFCLSICASALSAILVEESVFAPPAEFLQVNARKIRVAELSGSLEISQLQPDLPELRHTTQPRRVFASYNPCCRITSVKSSRSKPWLQYLTNYPLLSVLYPTLSSSGLEQLGCSCTLSGLDHPVQYQFGSGLEPLPEFKSSSGLEQSVSDFR
ncbi:hypothetical protein SKAU_G00005390 [Synaphobranchus kaupii]|uniref:Uncharacterized protein n=1 Tax=Synaphobranchus kaupii TaxID=118154 RepID=A0A9Q1GA64_SYNKA|nr:hypothetical protein SKAU_G00005390 [Synaphobranchus kaupii]